MESKDWLLTSKDSRTFDKIVEVKVALRFLVDGFVQIRCWTNDQTWEPTVYGCRGTSLLSRDWERERERVVISNGSEIRLGRFGTIKGNSFTTLYIKAERVKGGTTGFRVDQRTLKEWNGEVR